MSASNSTPECPSYPNIGPPRIWNRRMSGSSRVRPALHPNADPRPPDTSGGRTTKHLVRPVLWPLLLIGQPTVQHRREQLRPEVLQNLAFRLGVLIFRQEVHVRRGSQVLEDALGDVGGVVLLGPCEVGWQRSDDHSRSMDDAHRYAARASCLRRPPSRSVHRSFPSVDRGAEASVSFPSPWCGRSRW